MTGKFNQRHAAAGDLAAAILESAHALVVTLDTEGRITSFNRACELLTGYKADEVIGDPIWDKLLPEEIVEPIRQLFASLPEGGEIPEDFENAWVTRDGNRPIIAWNNSVVRNAAGEIELIVGIGVDITERKATSDRLSRAQRIAGIGNWEWTIKTNEEYWSDQFFRNLGLEPGSIKSSVEKFYEFVHPGDREKVRAEILNALETKQPYNIDFRVIWPDGTERLVHEEAEAILDSAGEAVALTGTMQDVTLLRETEGHLQRLTTRLEYAQRAARVGNWEWDAATDRQWWSDECYRLIGCQPGEVEANDDSFFSVVHRDDIAMAKEISYAAERTGEAYEFACRVYLRDGTERVVREVGHPAYDDNGNYIGQNGTFQDITERHAAERDLAESAQRLGAAVRLAKLGTWEWHPESDALLLSDETARICGLGTAPVEILNEEILLMIHQDDSDHIMALMTKTLETGEPYNAEYRIIRPDGDVRTVTDHGERFTDNITGKVRIHGTIQDITERKRVERNMALTLRRLDISQEAALIGSWEWDIDIGKVWWSDQQYRNYGAEPDGAELSIESFFQYLHPADRDTVEAGIDKVMTDGAVFDQEYRIVGKDGVQRVLWCHGIAERDENGRPVNMVGTTLDITVRKDAEWRLAIMAEDLKNAQRIANIGSWERDILTNKENWSDQNYRIYGLEPGSIQPDADSFLQYVHSEDRDMLLAAQDAAIAGGPPLEIEYRSIGADGVERLIHASAEVERDSKGKAVRLAGTVQDITERKRIEQALQESEAHLRGIFDHAPIGIGLSNMQAELIEVNQQFADFLGYSTAEMIGLTYRDFTRPENMKIAQQQLDDLVAGDIAEISHEKLYTRRDGTTIWGHRTLSLIHDEAGAPKYKVVIVKDITDRKLAEEKLRETAINLENAQRIARIGGWEWDPATREVLGSDEMYRIYGLDPEKASFSMEIFLARISPEDREKYESALRTAEQNRTPYRVEYRLSRPDGSERVVEEKGEIIPGAPPGSTRFRGTIQDITERKLAEQALRDSEARLDAFFSEAPVGLAILDSQYRYVKINETIAKMNGVPAEKHTGKHPSEILIPEKAKLLENLLRRTLEHGKSIDGEESIIPDPDGEDRYRVYTQFPLSGDPKKPDTVGVVVVDITERVRAERALQQTMESLEEAQKIGQMGSWTWDQDNGAEWWSDQHYRIFGLEPESTILDGFGFLKYVHPDDRERVGKIQREAMENNAPFSIEYRVIWPDGTERIVSEHGEHFEDGSAGKPQWRGVVQDITERKHIEQELARLNAELEQRVEERTAELREAQGELIKSERLATLGQLTATVSHELRNPLGAVRTSMYVIEKKSESDDQRLRASIDRVNRNITRCDQIIDELLDYTRIRDLDLRQADIDRWLGAVLDEQDTPAEVTVKRKFGAKGARVPFDDGRLRRAFINIFENACHAATDPHNANGVARRPLISVKTSLRKNRVQIEISDNGAGIPPEIKEKIFEPLFSTKNFGVGLGLPTVRQIMQQHGGGIEIGESRDGGAKFALWLPLAGELEIAGK